MIVSLISSTHVITYEFFCAEVDRFAFSVLWRLDADANVLSTWFGVFLYAAACLHAGAVCSGGKQQLLFCCSS